MIPAVASPLAISIIAIVVIGQWVDLRIVRRGGLDSVGMRNQPPLFGWIGRMMYPPLPVAPAHRPRAGDTRRLDAL